jgi:flagellar biosynthesis protein FlhG
MISIGGGKGGVGKSMVSSNIAVQYAKEGLKVVLIDLDIGAANLHTIFGIRQPPKGLGEYFTTPRSQLSDYLLETSVENLLLVPGSGFVPELANMRHFQKVKIINQMRTIDADLILLDLGAGSSMNIVDFFSMTNAGVIVTTPEPTAIVNSYEFLKNVTFRILFRMLKNEEKLLKIVKKSAVPQKNKVAATIAETIAAIEQENPFFAENIRDVLGDLDFYLIFNQARKPSDTELFIKLQEICHRYLGLQLNVSGLIYYSDEVPSSVLKMTPISLSAPDSITTRMLRNHALNIMNSVADKYHKGIEIPFEKQYERAMSWAHKDFVENLLTQKRIQKDNENSYRHSNFYS